MILTDGDERSGVFFPSFFLFWIWKARVGGEIILVLNSNVRIIFPKKKIHRG